MDPVTLALLVLGSEIAIAFFGYLLKASVDNMKEQIATQKAVTDALRQDLNEVKVHYVSKAEFTNFENRLWERFDRLEDKLDAK